VTITVLERKQRQMNDYLHMEAPFCQASFDPAMAIVAGTLKTAFPE
jgi:hypothetical protein